MKSDKKLPIGTNFCLCSGCGEYFNSEYPFAMHRTKKDPRRCLSREEMTDLGMSISKKGYWISKTRSESAPLRPVSDDQEIDNDWRL